MAEKTGHKQRQRHMSLPAELVEKRRWICWALRYQEVPTKAGVLRQPRVLPFRPTSHGLHPLRRVDNPNDWTDFHRAARTAKQNPELDGPAFVNLLTKGAEEETYVMVVLHNAVDPQTKQIAPWAAPYLALAETYAEYGFAPRSIVLLFRGKRLKETKRYGSVYVYSPPFLALTGRHLQSTPKLIRWVGERLRPTDRQSRFERILQMAQESYERHRQRRKSPRDQMREVLAKASTKLGALYTLGTNMYAAPCPEGNGVMILHWQGPRLHIGCLSGPQKEPRELAEFLEIEYDPETVLPLDPTLRPHYQSLKDRLLPRGQGQVFQPVQGRIRRLIKQYQQALRNFKRIPPVLENTPLTYEDTLVAEMGYNPDQGSAIYVFHNPEGEPIYAIDYRRTNTGRIQRIVITPHQSTPSWISPDFTKRTESILIVEGLADAVLLNNLLRPNQIAVVGVQTLYQDPTEDFLRSIPPTQAYLYPGPEDEHARNAVARRWAQIASAAGHIPLLLEPLTNERGEPVSALRYAELHSRNDLVEAIIRAAENARNPLTEIVEEV